MKYREHEFFLSQTLLVGEHHQERLQASWSGQRSSLGQHSSTAVLSRRRVLLALSSAVLSSLQDGQKTCMKRYIVEVMAGGLLGAVGIRSS